MSTMTRDLPQSAPHAIGRTRLLVGSWTAAGGVAGGLFVTTLVLLGDMHPDDVMLLLTALLVAVGAGLGTVHGAVLAWLSHPPREAPRPGGLLWDAGSAAAGFTAALVISLWITMSAALLSAGIALAWLGALTGIPVAVLLCLWAAVVGWDALRAAYGRWPEHRLGSVLLVSALAIVTATLLALRPTLHSMHVDISPPVAIMLACLATLWVAAPAIVVALHYGHWRR